MMRMNKCDSLIRLASVVMVVALVAVICGACNTIEGVGEDLSAAGQTMADWANNDDDGK